MKIYGNGRMFLFACLLGASSAFSEDRFQYVLNSGLYHPVDFNTSGGFDPWETTTCYGGTGQCKYMDFHVRSISESGTTCVDIFTQRDDVGDTDIAAHIRNESGVWQAISDDDGGNAQPRFFVQFSNTGFQFAEIRLLGYGTAANNDNFILNIPQTAGACPTNSYPILHVTGSDLEDRYIEW